MRNVFAKQLYLCYTMLFVGKIISSKLYVNIHLESFMSICRCVLLYVFDFFFCIWIFFMITCKTNLSPYWIKIQLVETVDNFMIASMWSLLFCLLCDHYSRCTVKYHYLFSSIIFIYFLKVQMSFIANIPTTIAVYNTLSFVLIHIMLQCLFFIG